MNNRKGYHRITMILAFIAIYFIWGTTYLANLFGLESITPFVLSSLRYLVAGLLLLTWVIGKRLVWPDLYGLKVLSVSGILMLVGGSGLVVFAEQYINSGYAAVIVASEPFWFVLLDKKHWKFYFNNRNILLGLFLGFSGIVLFSYFSPESGIAGTSDKLIGTSILLVSAVLWVMGTLYANKRMRTGTSNITNSAIQLLAAGIFSALIALCLGEWKQFTVHDVSPKAWFGLIFLIVMGSMVAYMAFTWLVTVQPPAVVSTHTYVNPMVAVFIGWLIADERIAPHQIYAFVLVLGGVLLTQMGKKISLKPNHIKEIT